MEIEYNKNLSIQVKTEFDSFLIFKDEWDVVKYNFLILHIKMCQYLEGLQNTVNQYFPKHNALHYISQKIHSKSKISTILKFLN